MSTSIAHTVCIVRVQQVHERQQQILLIERQIEYYFSESNLLTDSFLCSQMDQMASVSVHTIAGFNRIRQHAANAPFDVIVEMVVEACVNSSMLQVLDVMLGRPPVLADRRIRRVLPGAPLEAEEPAPAAANDGRDPTRNQWGEHLSPVRPRVQTLV